MFSNNLLMAAASASGGGGYSVGNSILLNDNDSAYMSWTPSGAADSARIGTMSFWLKGGNLPTTTNNIIQQDWPSTGNNGITVQWNSTTYDNKLSFTMETSAGGIIFNKWTTLSFRDPTAWAHIWFTWDLNQTDSTCFTLYINGENITSFSTDTNNGSAQDGGFLTTTKAIGLGRHQANGNAYLDGYLSQVYVQDGVTGVYTDAGEFDDQGEWRPIDVTGLTFGTNGFLLDFAVAPGTGNGAGTDVSGNGNNFTDSGLSAADQVTDTPTDNFCTWSSVHSSSGATLANGNLEGSLGTNNQGILGTLSVSSGKWYWEYTIGATRGVPYMGAISTGSATVDPVSTVNAVYYDAWAISYAAEKYDHGAYVSDLGTDMAAGDIVQIAVDLDNGRIWFGLNDSWWEGDPSAGTGASFTNVSGPITPAFQNSSTGSAIIGNFGQSGLTYTPPTDFLELKTSNMTALDFDPADHHGVELVDTSVDSTFTVPSDASTTDYLFVIKDRDNSEKWWVFDSLNGLTNYTSFDATTAQTPDATTLSVSTTTITMGAAFASSNYVVEWWRAGETSGSGVSNTEGRVGEATVTSTVSANTTSGFAIILHDMPAGSSAYTYGHGLDSQPEMQICKRMDSTSSWYVSHKGLTDETGYYLKLELNNDEAESAGVWGAGPTADVLGQKADGLFPASTAGLTTYTWHSVEGYSAFGSYEGNALSDGSVLNTGIKSVGHLTKNADTASSWILEHAAIVPYNAVATQTRPDIPNAEAAVATADLLSNGRKARDTGAPHNSAETFIYAQWGTPTLNKSGTPAKAR